MADMESRQCLWCGGEIEPDEVARIDHLGAPHSHVHEDCGFDAICAEADRPDILIDPEERGE